MHGIRGLLQWKPSHSLHPREIEQLNAICPLPNLLVGTLGSFVSLTRVVKKSLHIPILTQSQLLLTIDRFHNLTVPTTYVGIRR